MTDEDVYLLPEEQAAELKARSEAAKRRYKARESERFWAKTLQDPIGRSEIWRMLSDLNTFKTEFRITPNGSPDPNATWFWHGRATFGQDLYQHLLVCAREGVLKMHDEFDPRFQPDPIEHPNSNHEEQ